ncbi:hypothetical protein AB8B21_05145 [Tardiphaga sp. 866_E4_N2_1]|jgi:flagellar biosynthesis GTPase FlhF|uniref:hypothetical protein n=1 Tax=unclassified Tardiphaga TaxID=2631404 RepID=UPI003F297035
MEPRHLIRAAIAVSVVGHLALAAGVYFADARPMEQHEESVAVDLVTPQQLAEAEKKAEETPPEPEKKPEKKPEPEFRLPDLTNKPTLEEQKTQAVAAKPQSSAQNTPPQPQKTSPQQPAPSPQQQAAQQPPPPQQQAQQQPQATPATPPPSAPPATQPPLQQQAALQAQPPAPQPGPQQAPPQPEADITVKYGVMLGLPEGFGGGAASEQADLSKLDIAAFRRHLKTCSKLPTTVARGDDAKVKLRAVFSPDGRLVAEPTVIEVRRPAKAALLMQAAKQALEACQPYAMLPADKYDEWKVLDLDFTPQDFAG